MIPSRSGFSFLELLVTIGVIAILVSLLLGLVTRSRRMAETISCAANMRQIMIGATLYMSEHRGAIPGSPFTSGAHVRFSGNPASYVLPGVSMNATNQANTPDVVSYWDWVSPTARSIGIAFNRGGTAADRRDRFVQFLKPGVFMCPANRALATAYGPNWGTLPMMSYTTSIDFMLRHTQSTAGSSFAYGNFETRPEWNVPRAYRPNLTQIGDPSRKVFLSEGSRYVDSALRATYNSTVTDVQMGGAHADQRLHVASSFQRSRLLYGRYADKTAPHVTGSGRYLLLAYRHGTRSADGPADEYRMNLAFFDGHVERVNLSQSLDPVLHSPRGTRLNLTRAQTVPRTFQTFLGGVESPNWVVPE